jgi:hypothetical protein
VVPWKGSHAALRSILRPRCTSCVVLNRYPGSRGLQGSEREPQFGYILCPVESPVRQFLDPAHPVDKGLFMHAENLGSLLPRAIVRKESSQRLSKSLRG